MKNIHPEWSDTLEQIETDLLLEGIYRYYGYDFRHYSPASIRRRIWHRIRAERLSSISALQEKVLHDRNTLERLIGDFSINVTEMFRDPGFFLAFRQKAVPQLRSLPLIRIWHAGCSTGEEAYSMAILLHEEELYHKTTLYATDMNGRALEQAASSRFPLDKMQLYTRNYLQSGGTRAFSEYYSVDSCGVAFRPFLADRIVFSQHNLATDHSFNEFHIIICRNVLIYFDGILQERVIKLFFESLAASGFLGLGQKEAIPKWVSSGRFQEIDTREKLYRKTN